MKGFPLSYYLTHPLPYPAYQEPPDYPELGEPGDREESEPEECQGRCCDCDKECDGWRD